MKSFAIAKLRNDLLRRGLVSPLPVCPNCEQPIQAKQWDAHRKECREKQTPR